MKADKCFKKYNFLFKLSNKHKYYVVICITAKFQVTIFELLSTSQELNKSLMNTYVLVQNNNCYLIDFSVSL